MTNGCHNVNYEEFVNEAGPDMSKRINTLVAYGAERRKRNRETIHNQRTRRFESTAGNR